MGEAGVLSIQYGYFIDRLDWQRLCRIDSSLAFSISSKSLSALALAKYEAVLLTSLAKEMNDIRSIITKWHSIWTDEKGNPRTDPKIVRKKWDELAKARLSGASEEFAKFQRKLTDNL